MACDHPLDGHTEHGPWCEPAESSGALTSGERDLVLSDLGQLLEAVGLGDHARPQSPHEVFQMALAEVGRIGAVAAAAERVRIAQLANKNGAHYHVCGVPCSSEHSERPFADLIREESP